MENFLSTPIGATGKNSEEGLGKQSGSPQKRTLLLDENMTWEIILNKMDFVFTARSNLFQWWAIMGSDKKAIQYQKRPYKAKQDHNKSLEAILGPIRPRMAQWF